LKKTFFCNNRSCNKPVIRNSWEIESSGKIFCSNSCAAKINNITRNLNKPKKFCFNENCGREIKRSNKFCSAKCQWIVNSANNDEYGEIIIDKIKEFYKENGRIPFKQEMWGLYSAVKRIFGTWNKAIIAAGFKPNPVKFANKYIAQDGHKCDSLAEKIIDDWLFEKKIRHKTKVPYGYHQMTADYKIGNIYVEFFGLLGQNEKYDRLAKEKQAFYKEKNFHVIQIYPSDLFPKNKLDKIFSQFLINRGVV